jgi:hypothetical protein
VVADSIQSFPTYPWSLMQGDDPIGHILLFSCLTWQLIQACSSYTIADSYLPKLVPSLPMLLLCQETHP